MKYSKNNEPLVCMMTQSTCYKGTSKMTPKGVLWHSTGANNPTLKRYVQPDDNAPNRDELLEKIGKNKYGNDWNHIYLRAGVNAFIGELADGSVTTMQTLPWDFSPWGCGAGPNGSCNNGWMQFEICEDDLTDKAYFNTVYEEACELTAYYCKMYNLDPLGTVKYNGIDVPVILDHISAHDLGLGSNHGDIQYWLKKYGKTLDNVRQDVAKLLKEVQEPTDPKELSDEKKQLIPEQLVRISEEAVYYNGKNIPDWVKKQNWYVKSVSKDRVVIDKSENGKHSIYSAINAKYLIPVESETTADQNQIFEPYLIKVDVGKLNCRKGPGLDHRIVGRVRRDEVYTIVETDGDWGRLKSGAGWIYLPYTKKL